MQVHLQGARERRQARNALDAFGFASITVRASDGKRSAGAPVIVKACVTVSVVPAVNVIVFPGVADVRL